MPWCICHDPWQPLWDGRGEARSRETAVELAAPEAGVRGDPRPSAESTVQALMSLSLFNQSFTGDQLGAMLAAESDAAAGVLAPVELSQHNRLWFCKRHAFEVGELRTRGVPAAVADAFNDRAHHLY